ncbi:MAG: hypothetical protein MI757_14005 [Pirellulales bacterium]|nr:hypothetical protein [Pirellulales bacterium]
MDATASSVASTRVGENASLVFACPECKTRGRVFLRQLPHVMHCPKCRVRFWIARDGKLKSERDCEHVRFECPCCHSVRHVVGEFASDGVTCNRCGKRSFSDRDGKYRIVGERSNARRSVPDAIQPRKWSLPRLGMRSTIAATVLGVLAVVAVVVAVVPDESLQSAAVAFTKSCANGEFDAAADRTMTGDEASLRSWSMLVVPTTPRSALRGSPEVDIESSQVEDDQATVRLIVERRGMGRRLITQHWRRHDGRWKFDTQRSLNRIVSTD